MALITTTRGVHGITVVDLAGDIALGNSATSFRDAIRREGAKNAWIIVNMAGVKFVDSAGLGEMVGCHTTMRNRRGAIRFVNIPPQIQELLEMTRLNTLFEVFDDEASALRNFPQQNGH
jgi:anti-sigma B factor antagonist